MPDGRHGFFTGEVKTLWGTHKKKDQDMQLIENFSYTDPDEKEWIAKKDYWIDGASIPSIFWGPTLGSPFVGDYRRASVVHDAGFIEHQGTAMETHKMFYHAMRCDGTKKSKALLMYFAVVIHTPSWGKSREISSNGMARIQSVLLDTLLDVDKASSLEDIEVKFQENWKRPSQDGDELYL